MPQTIRLKKPLTGHGGQITEITVREPTYGDLVAVGVEPTTVVFTGNGSGFVQTDVAATQRYAERLVQPREALDVLHLLSIHDALALQRVIAGFFREEAEEESPGTSPSPTSSSSG